MHWLSSCFKPWLLVIDNADDPELDISKYFPAGRAGHILITTRNPGTTIHATAGHLSFRGLDPEDAIALLLRYAYPQTVTPSPNPARRTLAHGIVSELGYLALAIVQAGVSIRRNIYTLEKYLHYYLGHRRIILKYPKVTAADEANIITTWEIPLQRISKRPSPEHRDAIDLMHIFAFMHFECIPNTIFETSWPQNELSAKRAVEYPIILQVSAVWNEEAKAQFRRAVRVLCDYSIVEYEPRKRFSSMHPVVHRWARDRLDDQEQAHWLCLTMAVLANCISPALVASEQQIRRALLPHIDSCLRTLKSQSLVLPSTIEQSTQLERFASVYAENGLWRQALGLYRSVVDFRGKVLGSRHDLTIQAQSSLGFTYWNLFEIKSAIDVQVQVLKSRWWSRPSITSWASWPPWQPDHTSYGAALDDLTLTLWLAGKREISKKAGERSVEILAKRLGHDDPSTLTAMFNLARTYLHLGDHIKCQNLLAWVLKRRKHFFGLDHPDTLMTRNELGMTLCARKLHLAAAERLVANVLETRRKILGDEHAYTLWSVNDLSKVLCQRGHPERAASLLKDILPVVQRTLGDQHAGMFMTRSNLARAYVLCERWTDAVQLLKPLLEVIPLDHPDWVHTMSGYIHVRIHLNQLDGAKSDCIKLLEHISQTEGLAQDDHLVLAIANQLASICQQQGHPEEIASFQKQFPVISQAGNAENSEVIVMQR